MWTELLQQLNDCDCKFAVIEGDNKHFVHSLDEAFSLIFQLEKAKECHNPYKTYRGTFPLDIQKHNFFEPVLNVYRQYNAKSDMDLMHLTAHIFEDKTTGYQQTYLIYTKDMLDDYDDVWEDNFHVVRTDHFRELDQQFIALCGKLGVPADTMAVNPEHE